MNAATYLLDTDVLITAKNRYYSFKICPGFWESLLHYNGSSRVLSIDRVKQEILFGNKEDKLVQWVKTDVPDGFFEESGESDVVSYFTDIMMWAQRHQRYTDAAKAKFASGADGWLVAFAKAKGYVLITNEQPAPDSSKAIKLPDVCNEFEVLYNDTFAMLEELNVGYSFAAS